MNNTQSSKKESQVAHLNQNRNIKIKCFNENQKSFIAYCQFISLACLLCRILCCTLFDTYFYGHFSHLKCMLEYPCFSLIYTCESYSVYPYKQNDHGDISGENEIGIIVEICGCAFPGVRTYRKIHSRLKLILFPFFTSPDVMVQLKRLYI